MSCIKHKIFHQSLKMEAGKIIKDICKFKQGFI